VPCPITHLQCIDDAFHCGVAKVCTLARAVHFRHLAKQFENSPYQIRPPALTLGKDGTGRRADGRTDTASMYYAYR